jgi:hypothetical protein
VGRRVGAEDGLLDGPVVGCMVGLRVGLEDGAFVGPLEGAWVGLVEGRVLGNCGAVSVHQKTVRGWALGLVRSHRRWTLGWHQGAMVRHLMAFAVPPRPLLQLPRLTRAALTRSQARQLESASLGRPAIATSPVSGSGSVGRKDLLWGGWWDDPTGLWWGSPKGGPWGVSVGRKGRLVRPSCRALMMWRLFWFVAGLIAHPCLIDIAGVPEGRPRFRTCQRGQTT